MRKLLTIYFLRLMRDKLFWLLMVLMFVLSVLYMDGAHLTYGEAADLSVFHVAGFIGFGIVTVSSLLLGTEYSDGTLRNKIVAGHSKVSIYLSCYLTSVMTGLLLLLAYWLGVALYIRSRQLVIANPHLVLLGVLCCFAMVLAFSALATLIAMNGSRKTATNLAAAALILAALIYIPVRLERYVGREQYRYGYYASVVTGNGYELTHEADDLEDLEFQLSMMGELWENAEIHYGITYENPYYVGGIKRDVFEFLYNALPNGQAIQMLRNGFWDDPSQSEQKAALWCACDAGAAAVMVAAGFVLFHKRNLN